MWLVFSRLTSLLLTDLLGRVESSRGRGRQNPRLVLELQCVSKQGLPNSIFLAKKVPECACLVEEQHAAISAGQNRLGNVASQSWGPRGTCSGKRLGGYLGNGVSGQAIA